MTTEARTICIEALFNTVEVSRLDRLRGGLGRSPYLRHLVDVADRVDSKATPAQKESRGCRGLGRPASRAGAGLFGRRQI